MAQVVSKDGTKIAYEKSGKGPAVILIDGAMGHRGHFGGLPLAAALSGNFTVITYDRRGRGESEDTLPYAVDREIEDIEALIDTVGAHVNLYGFSSGAVLALRAAAKLKNKVRALAVLEPPFGDEDDAGRKEFQKNFRTLSTLLREGKKSEAVSFFLQDMLPPSVLEGMKNSPGWNPMVKVAHTLAYDYQVMGDGAMPAKIANSVTIPTLVLDGEESPGFKHAAANAMAGAMGNSERKTIKGHHTSVPPDVLAPLLIEFFKSRNRG